MIQYIKQMENRKNPVYFGVFFLSHFNFDSEISDTNTSSFHILKMYIHINILFYFIYIYIKMYSYKKNHRILSVTVKSIHHSVVSFPYLKLRLDISLLKSQLVIMFSMS